MWDINANNVSIEHLKSTHTPLMKCNSAMTVLIEYGSEDITILPNGLAIISTVSFSLWIILVLP